MSDSHQTGALQHAILTKPVLLQVQDLFLPLLAYYVISSLVGVADMFLAGDLGSDAQAAVGIGDQVIFLVVALGTGLATAASSFVSRSVGAGDSAMTYSYARESLVLATIIGILSTISGWVGAETLMEIFKCSAPLKEHAVPYIQICSLANVPFVVFMCQSAILRAIGRANEGTMIGVVGTAVSVVGSVIAFYFIPEPWGRSLLSLALAWIFGASSAMAYGFLLLRKEFIEAGLRFDKDSTERLFMLTKTAAPAVAGEFAFIGANFVRYALLAGLPDSAPLQAAWTIRLKLEETVAILPLMALSYSVAVVCGHQIGAGNQSAVMQICSKVATLAALAMLIIGLMLSCGASLIGGIFTTDPDTLRSVVTLMVPSPILLPACAIWLVLNGGLDGAGKTRVTGFLNGFDAVAGRWLLSMLLIGDGLAGLVSASTVSSVVTALLSVFLFWHCFRPKGARKVSKVMVTSGSGSHYSQVTCDKFTC